MPRNSHHTASRPSSQVPLVEPDLWHTEVVPLLPVDLETQARSLGAFTRRRELACASDLLRGLLAYVLVAASFQHLGAWGVLARVASLSAPAWQKRLVASRTWLCWLLTELLAVEPPTPSFRLVPHPHGNLLLVDATTLGQPGGTGDDWRLHSAYNFRSGRLVQVTLTDRRGGEHLGHYTLRPTDIVVADNGYGYRTSVATVRKQQAQLVTRIRPSTFPFTLRNGQVLDVVPQLRKRGPTVREWYGWCTDADGERYVVRLVAAKLPPLQAAAARKRTQRRAQQHGRRAQPDTLEVAGWVLVLTTLVEALWTAEDILRAYRVRWQIEVVFKRMKSVLGLGALRGRTRVSLEAAIYALLIAWLLQASEAARVRHVLRQLAPTTQRVVSSWVLTTVSVDVLQQQVRGGWGAQRVQACLPQLQRYLTSSPRDDRAHQETTLRTWLARRPTTRLVLREAA
jgi:Transposase DDE domain